MNFFDHLRPLGDCFQWRADVLWTHVALDAVITVAYFSMAVAVLYFMRKRRDLARPIVGWIITALILLGGWTHMIGIWSVWHGGYGYEALIKSITAVAAVVAATVAWRLMPSALAVPNKQMLQERISEATAKLQASNVALGEANSELENFVSVASHDLKEPLRTLTAFSRLLGSDLGDNLPDVARNDLSQIMGAASRMQNLIGKLLELSQSSKAELQLQSILPDSCANAALRALDELLKERNAVIERDRLPEVRGDRTLVTQTYQNLLSNALKFIAKDVTARIRLTAEETADGEVILGVADNGVGIEPAMRDRIFGAFERLNPQGEFEGAGIGLTICRRAITRMGGRIWAEDSVYGGTHFKFTLRRAVAVPEVDQQSMGQAHTGHLAC